MRRLANICRLGVKELWSLAREPMLLILIVFSFTASHNTATIAAPETLHRAPIAIIDEDVSPLPTRIALALYPPQFTSPQMISRRDWTAAWTPA